jgi:hypothetical protein
MFFTVKNNNSIFWKINCGNNLVFAFVSALHKCFKCKAQILMRRLLLKENKFQGKCWDLSRQLESFECHSNWEGETRLTNQNPHIPSQSLLTWHSGTKVVGRFRAVVTDWFNNDPGSQHFSSIWIHKVIESWSNVDPDSHQTFLF